MFSSTNPLEIEATLYLDLHALDKGILLIWNRLGDIKL
jgi:hypothetical protein